MNRWLALVVAVGLVPAGAWAGQMPPADSLRALLRTQSRADTVRVRQLQALSQVLMMTDLPEATIVLEQALALSRQLGDGRGEGQALIRLGTLNRLQTNYLQARRYTQQAQALFRRQANFSGLSTAYLQLSLIENAQSNLASALRAALQGLPYAERAGNKQNQIRLQMVIGSNYVQLGNYKDALPILQSTLHNARALHDGPVIASVLTLLGDTYQLQQNWRAALTYYRRAGRQNRKLGDFRSATSNEISMADLQEQQRNYPQALRLARQARTAARANKDAYNLPLADLVLARTYLALGHADSAIALARHALSLSLNQRERSKENLRNASDILARAYAQGGSFAQAYHYQSLWVAYKDSISGEEAQKQTSALRYGYELDKKQAQIALLTKTRQLQAQRAARQRQQLYALLAGLVGTVLVAGLLARNIHLKQRTNRALNDKNDHIAQQRDDLNRALLELKATQTQLVQSEKMVALAALTAGVAHEIQNPLNFVNNFSEVSAELVAELEEEAQNPNRDAALEAGLLGDLKQNLRKIHQHGSRAGDIVKGMLQHARADTGQRQPVDLNALVQDYLRLAYHSLQARYPAAVVARTLALEPQLAPLQLVPQEIGRVLLNLFTNAFYAVHQKSLLLGPAYQPEIRVTTRQAGAQAELRVHDNGTGIAAAAVDKIFDPFFTTKPPGEGTGLGRWLSYDIITKGYGGTITVHSQEGSYTELVLLLPSWPPVASGRGAGVRHGALAS